MNWWVSGSYGASLERKHEDIYLPCPPGKLLGEDEICYSVLVEGIVKSTLDIIFICHVLKQKFMVSFWKAESNFQARIMLLKNTLLKTNLVLGLWTRYVFFFLESQWNLRETHCSHQNSYLCNPSKLEILWETDIGNIGHVVYNVRNLLPGFTSIFRPWVWSNRISPGLSLLPFSILQFVIAWDPKLSKMI